MIVQARRSAFIPTYGPLGGVDGAHLIKVTRSLQSFAVHLPRQLAQSHPWFRGIDWENIHRYPAPYRPQLSHPEDTRHFDDDIPPEVSCVLNFHDLSSPRCS